MNLKVFILAVAAITVGLVELIVGGILPIIAKDLNVTIGTAGQLITAFALVYAISGPILLSLTAKIERKKLYLIALSRSEEHTSELQSRGHLVCRLLLE